MKTLLASAVIFLLGAPTIATAAGGTCGYTARATTTAAIVAKQTATTQANIIRSLSGRAIQELLAGNSAVYDDGAKQYFASGGRTLYQSPGRPTEHGTWRVRGDNYCSTWQPRASESCYAMHSDGQLVTFNQKFPARMQEGNVFQ